MSSRSYLLLGLVAAFLLLIVSEVAARDLSEASQNAEVATETNADGRGGYNRGGGYGGGGHGGRGHGGGGHGGGGHGGGGHGGGGGCRYGCCGRGGPYSRGCRCCSYAGEAVEVETQAKPHN